MILSLLLQRLAKPNCSLGKMILQQEFVTRSSKGDPSEPLDSPQAPKSIQSDAMESFRANSSFHGDAGPPIVIESLSAVVGASAAQANTSRLFRSPKACFNRSLKDSSPLLSHFRGS